MLRSEVDLARTDCNAFCEFVLSDKEGKPIRQQWFHEEWQNAANKHQDLLIIGPQEHGKTEQIAIGRSLWRLGKNPNRRIKIICANDEEARKRVSAIAEHIEKNKKVHLIFPDLKPSNRNAWTSQKIFVERSAVGMKDPSVEAKGVLSTGSGGRADDLIFDDPVDLRNAIQNSALRQSVISAIDNVWVNLLDPDGRIIYICTLWHKADATHVLMKRGKFKMLFYRIGDNFEPIWVSKWGAKELKDRCEKIGLRNFQRGFQNKPLMDEESIFRNIGQYKNEVESLEKIQPEWPCFLGVDLATLKKKSNFNVLFTLALSPQGKRYPKEIVRRRMGGIETAREVVNAFLRHRHQIIMVENNAYQDVFLEWVKYYCEKEGKQVALPLKSYTTGKQKMDPNIGLPSLAAEIDNGYWEILMGGEHGPTCRCAFCVWIQEMLDYPIGEYDDTVMGCFFAKEGAKLGVRSTKIETLGKPREVVKSMEGF